MAAPPYPRPNSLTLEEEKKKREDPILKFWEFYRAYPRHASPEAADTKYRVVIKKLRKRTDLGMDAEDWLIAQAKVFAEFIVATENRASVHPDAGNVAQSRPVRRRTGLPQGGGCPGVHPLSDLIAVFRQGNGAADTQLDL